MWANLRKGVTSRKTRFFAIFQIVTISRPQEPQASHLVCKQFGPSTSQIHIRSYSKPVPSGERPKWGIKGRFLNVIARPAHTGCEQGSQFAASVAGWCKNILARFDVEGPNCLQTKWEAWGSWGLGMVTVWKMVKKTRFAQSGPFLISYHIYL